MSDFQASLEVNEQLISRCTELERRLYDAERKALQLQVALQDANLEFERERSQFQDDSLELKKLREVLNSKENEVERLHAELDHATHQAHEADSELLAALADKERGRGVMSETMRVHAVTVDRSVQATEDEADSDLVRQLRDRIMVLEKELDDYENAEHAESVSVPTEGTETSMVTESPRFHIPALKLGGGQNLNATTRRSQVPANAGPTPRQASHVMSTPRESAKLGGTFSSSMLPMSTPRIFPAGTGQASVSPASGGLGRESSASMVQETPRIAGAALMLEASQMLKDAMKDPTALARLRDAIATSNIEMMTTPRNLPLPLRVPSSNNLGSGRVPSNANLAAARVPSNNNLSAPQSLEQKGRVASMSVKHMFEFQPTDAGCRLCNLLCDIDMKFPASSLKTRRTYLGAGWIPDICTAWRTSHSAVWTLEERAIVQAIVDNPPKLRSFPASRHEGELSLYSPKASGISFWKRSWKETYGLVHGIFLLLFPLRNPEAELTSVSLLRGATIRHLTHDGRANCLSIESIGCSKCVNATEGMRVEHIILSFPTPTDAQRWTEALIEAQRTCPHECSNVFGDTPTIRDVVEELLRDENVQR